MDANPAEWSASRNYHFLTSAVAPRPIAWVTTMGTDGLSNAAPFSWYQAVCADPPMVMLALADRSDGTPKDTLRNIQETEEFVVNAVTHDLIEPMVGSSAEFPDDVSELDELGLETIPSLHVRPPRIKASPLHMECKLVETHRYGRGSRTTMIVGEVIHFHCEDRFLDDRGNFQPHEAHVLARLGGADYLQVDSVFAHRRPRPDDAQRAD